MTDQGYKPLTVRCCNCRKEVVPIQRIRPSCKTHLLATVLFCLFFPCAMIPYYIDDLQETQLYCPNCNAYIDTLCT
ncbi:hypothetical protein DOY81_008951 [Sarcophaga bullata]|nr:hypothetical protein DOY81_008951 [Sarcophaga bullata]